MAEDKGVSREIRDYTHRKTAIDILRKSDMIFPRAVKVPDEFLDEDGNLIIPDDVSEIETELLAHYFSVFTALAAYYEAVVASADIDKTTADRVRDFIEAKTYIELAQNSHGAVTDKKEARKLDPKVVAAQDWADEQEAVFKLASALLKGVDRILFLISREITRRGNVISSIDRDKNIGTGGRPTPPILGGSWKGDSSE